MQPVTPGDPNQFVGGGVRWGSVFLDFGKGVGSERERSALSLTRTG